MLFQILPHLAKLRILAWLAAFAVIPAGAFAGGEDETYCDILVPSAISPNGDGINDWLEIKASCQFSECIFKVYDSRHRIVFQTNVLDQRWDATINGKPVPDGHYTWEITYSALNGNSTKPAIKSGVITIIR